MYPVPIGEELVGSNLRRRAESKLKKLGEGENMTHVEVTLASIRLYKRYRNMRAITPMLVVVLMLTALGISLARATEQQSPIATTISVVFFLGAWLILGFSWRMYGEIKLLSKRLNKEFEFATGLVPPDSNDWVAMKVIQQIVDGAMTAVKTARDLAFERENALLEVEAGKMHDTEFIASKIARVKEDHHRVEEAKVLVACYAALFRLYHFNVSER
jgi:hypothetical protein